MPARLFLAIWPDERARVALTHDLDRIRAEMDDVRWQPPERWHITMAFLGPADAQKATARMQKLVHREPLPSSGPLRLRGSGTFNTVIWAGVQHGDWLSTLAGIFRTAHVDDQPFRAHLTVGRIRGPQPARRARLVAERLSGVEGPTWTPGELTLVASHGGPHPQYHILHRWLLPQAGQ